MRFRITWIDGQYKVSIPGYEGGEVVTAEYLEQQLEIERGNTKKWREAYEREYLLRMVRERRRKAK